MAKAKGGKVTEKEKKRMWELYQECGCFKTVGRKLHRSPDTVSRHVKLYEAALSVAHAILDEK
jgi:hypothetical protein